MASWAAILRDNADGKGVRKLRWEQGEGATGSHPLGNTANKTLALLVTLLAVQSIARLLSELLPQSAA